MQGKDLRDGLGGISTAVHQLIQDWVRIRSRNCDISQGSRRMFLPDRGGGREKKGHKNVGERE